MKLSQMTVEQAAQTIIKISDPMERMMSDINLENHFKEFSNLYRENVTVIRLTGYMLGRFLPALLKEHKEDVYLVVSAMTGKPIEEVREEKLTVFIRDCLDFVDKDFVDFFRYTTPAVKEAKT